MLRSPALIVILVAAASCGGPSKEKCDATSCKGCCNPLGECRVGSESSACGAPGGVCAPCSQGQICSFGICVGPASGAGGGSGGGTGGTGDGGSSACINDTSCSTGKCHPVLRTCEATCIGAIDCPATQKSCRSINNSAFNFCTCTTDALCAAAVPGNICNTVTQQCSARCTATSCPTGFSCDTTRGQCTTGNNTDAGTDAGVIMDAGIACNNANQPDTCGYANVCGAASSCERIANGTCSNVAAHPQWDTSSTGPVIYRVVDEAIDNQAACAPGNAAFTTTVFAYARPGQTFPVSKSALLGFRFYSATGTQIDIPTNMLTQANYTRYANDTVMSATFTICAMAGSSSLVAGFGFANGNSACATLTR